MRHVLRVLRNPAFALLACSAPLVCFAAVELGVELSDSVYAVSDPFYSVDGAIISAVKPGSLADANGLRPDDLVVRIEGKRIRSARDLQEELQKMARRKRDVRIIFMRYGSFETVRLHKRAFRARPFVAANGMKPQSAEQCLRSPSVDCLRDHLLTELKREPDNVRDAAGVSRQFLRIGRPDLASEFLNLATESFLARSRTLDSYDFIDLARAHRAAGVPLPPPVVEKAARISKEPLGLNGAVRGLHVAGNTELAERLLQEALAATQARHERFTQLDASSYSDVASGYARLGQMQSAGAVKLDSRFSPEERLKLDLAIAGTLVAEQRYEVVPNVLDVPLAAYRTTSASIEGGRFSEAARLYWQSANVAATEQIAEYLVARTKDGAAAGVSRRDDIDPTVEVLGLLGRIPEALTLIEVSMTGAEPARRAEVDYRLVSGAIRRSGQNELDSRLRPVVERALANWKSAYAEADQWPKEYERSISHLYRLLARNGSDPPTAAEMEWQAGPSIDATARQSLGAAIAAGVLRGLNEARRTDVGPAWVMSARAPLKADSRSPAELIRMVMLMAADGNLEQAIRFGEEVLDVDWHVEVARDEARSISVPSLVAAREFETIARIYGTLTRPIQKMNVLVDVLIPIAGRCDTCTI
jgi:hypothetical protein